MKIVSLQESPEIPVSHDPSLVKRLLVGEGVLPGIRSLSHIVLPPGKMVAAHSHDSGYEVFYCIRGRTEAVAGNERPNSSRAVAL